MLIDMHTHTFLRWKDKNEGEKTLLKAIEKYDITKAYVSNFTVPDSSEEEVDEGNRITAELVKAHPDCIGGYVYVNPKNKNTVDVIKRGIEEMGLEAIKLWVGTFCDDECVNKVAEQAIEYGVPIMQHAFHKSVGQLPFETVGKHIANLAIRYPELKLIMAHLGGNCYNGIPMIKELENVWVDISSSIFGGDALDYTIENIGVDRILFGSDIPGTFIVNVGKVNEADITDEEREMIFYKNTLRVFDRKFRL